VKFSPSGNFESDLHGGDGMECQGVMVWSCNFNTSCDPITGVYMLGLTRIGLVVAEIWGENFPHSEICASF